LFFFFFLIPDSKLKFLKIKIVLCNED